jgi:hypothetical protein
MHQRIRRSFKSAKNYWTCKSQLRKSQKIYGLQITNPQIATFAKVCKSKKKFKSANLQLCDLRKLFVGL